MVESMRTQTATAEANQLTASVERRDAVPVFACDSQSRRHIPACGAHRLDKACYAQRLAHGARAFQREVSHMNICHAGGDYVVTMHGWEIFRTADKSELLKFVNNVVKGW